jgi:tetratricopeptide (TPR) repeat protein
MKDYRQDRDNIHELIRQFLQLRAGKPATFLDEEAFDKIIDYYDENEDLALAMEAAEAGIERFPYSSQLLLRKADLLIATRKYQEALQLLDYIELLDATDINIYILKTDAYLALDEQEKAVRLLENALTLFQGEDKKELLFELADVYDDYEEFEKIFDCLKLILEEDPGNEEALYKICFWTDFTGRNEESIQLHTKIIDEVPYNELAWFNLGAAYQGLKLYEKAIDAYKYAVAIDEKFDYAYRNMGDAYIRLRQYREAIEVLERVLELSRPEDVIFEAIGYCYEKLKNYAQARFYYKKASHLNQEESRLVYKIACTYMYENQWATAAQKLEYALKMPGSSLDCSLAMGECLMQLGNYREAIHHFSLVIRNRPKNIQSWESLIRCLYYGEFYDEALEQVVAARKLTSNKPVFLYYQSAINLASGRFKEGLLFLEAALETAPRSLKKFISLDPSLLQHQQVVDLVARYRKNIRS